MPWEEQQTTDVESGEYGGPGVDLRVSYGDAKRMKCKVNFLFFLPCCAAFSRSAWQVEEWEVGRANQKPRKATHDIGRPIGHAPIPNLESLMNRPDGQRKQHNSKDRVHVILDGAVPPIGAVECVNEGSENDLDAEDDEEH